MRLHRCTVNSIDWTHPAQCSLNSARRMPVADATPDAEDARSSPALSARRSVVSKSHHPESSWIGNGAIRPNVEVQRESRCSRCVPTRAGCRSRTPRLYSLRHSFAMRLFARGVGIKAIGDPTGHNSLVSTAVYLRLQTSVLRHVALPVPTKVEPD